MMYTEDLKGRLRKPVLAFLVIAGCLQMNVFGGVSSCGPFPGKGPATQPMLTKPGINPRQKLPDNNTWKLTYDIACH